MKRIRGSRLLVILGAMLMSQHVHAADSLTLKGRLIVSACTVQNVEVNWGDIEIQSLVQNGKNQKDSIVDMNYPYSLGIMRAAMTSNGQTGNSVLMPDTLAASGDGLFIHLYNNNNSGIGNTVTLGSRFTSGKITGIAPARKITLYAELGYKGNMQNSRAGIFSATATLVTSYS